MALELKVRSGNTDSDAGSATYQPDPGWAISNFSVSVNTDFGETSKSISYVQANSVLVTDQEIQQTYDLLINAALQKGLDNYAGQFQVDRTKALNARHTIASTNRGIVAEAHCSGQGLFGGGASLDFSIFADEVYVGTSGDLQQIKQFYLNIIQTTSPRARETWSGAFNGSQAVFKLAGGKSSGNESSITTVLTLPSPSSKKAQM